MGQCVVLVGSSLQIFQGGAQGGAIHCVAGVLQRDDREVVLCLRNTGIGGPLEALGGQRQVALRAQALRMQQAQIKGRAGVALFGSLLVDQQLTRVVGRSLQSLGLQQAQLVKRCGVVLGCRFLQPEQGAHFVGWDIAARVQQHAGRILRQRIALRGRLQVERQRCGQVLAYAHALGMHHAQVVLCPCIA